MISLHHAGAFLHRNNDLSRFPELQLSSVSLKRIADGPAGLARFFWLADKITEPSGGETPAEMLEQLVKARTWQLEEATLAKSRFLTTMSHEIRTPLCGMMGSLTLLEDSPLTAEQLQIVRVANLCGEQLLVLINDVLDRAKLDEGKLVLELLPFLLHDVLADSLEILATVAAQKGLELILDVQPDVPIDAVGDPFRLRQIILNLVSNACKFTKEGHVLMRVSAKLLDSSRFTLFVDVEDTGIGMSSLTASHLFQPFTQGDQSTRRHFGGTGLGLCIAQQIAQLMSGWVRVESTEGVGSKFHVEVALGRVSNALSSFPLPLAITNHHPVLLVIRNATLRALLARKLIEWGFNVVALGTSTEAIALKKEDFTMLLADINGRPDDNILLQQFAMVTILLRQGGEEERLKQALTKTDKILLSKPVRMNELAGALYRALHPGQAVPGLGPAQRHLERVSLRILLAEDNVTNQLIVGKMLRRLGQLNVTLVNDGQEAVDACLTTRFDLIFMDIMMPELNGWDATVLIRALPGPRVFIVALTANVSREDRKHCLDVDMDRVITKPIQMIALADSLDAVAAIRLTLRNSQPDVSA
jgi:signal transduction histidine kinase/CheY-like chemotaxis protein